MSQSSSSAKILTIGFLALVMAVASAQEASAWDNCGVGRHRTAWRECVSNYATGPGVRGCPAGYHWGNYTHACFPNHYW
jgi:hypothetical protein